MTNECFVCFIDLGDNDHTVWISTVSVMAEPLQFSYCETHCPLCVHLDRMTEAHNHVP